MIFKKILLILSVSLVVLAIFFAGGKISNAYGVPTSCSASPQTIVAGGTSKITWSSPGTYCIGTQGWSGSFAGSGSQDVSPKDTTTYTTQCFNTDGTSTACAAHVYVLDAALRPTVSCSASSSKIKKGQSATITWNSKGASECFASGGWAGQKTASGAQTVSPNTATAYLLNCPAFGFDAQCSVIVDVEEETAAPSGQVVADATITCNNGKPTAPTKNIAVPEGNYVCLDANQNGGKGGSRSGGGTIIKYEWDLNSDGLFSNTSQDKSCFNSPICPVAFTPYASVTLNLKVTDDRGFFALDSVSVGLLKTPAPAPAPKPAAAVVRAPIKTAEKSATVQEPIKQTLKILSSASIFDKAYPYNNTELVCRLFK